MAWFNLKKAKREIEEMRKEYADDKKAHFAYPIDKKAKDKRPLWERKASRPKRISLLEETAPAQKGGDDANTK